MGVFAGNQAALTEKTGDDTQDPLLDSLEEIVPGGDVPATKETQVVDVLSKDLIGRSRYVAFRRRHLDEANL
jgi:hypothetical protein